MTVTIDIELTQEQADALLAWKDTPYRGCNDYLPVMLNGVGNSLWNMRLIESSPYPGVNGYKISDLGKQVRAKLQEPECATPESDVQRLKTLLRECAAMILSFHGCYYVKHEVPELIEFLPEGWDSDYEEPE